MQAGRRDYQFKGLWEKKDGKYFGWGGREQRKIGKKMFGDNGNSKSR